MLTNTRLLPAIVIVVLGSIAAFAVASSVRAQVSDNAAARLRANDENAAISLLHSITFAEDRYHQRCAGYAPDLNELLQTHYLPPTKLTDGAIVRNGYKFSIEPEGTAIPVANLPSGCIGSMTDFFSHADPIAPDTGARYFASDARRIMFLDSVPMTYPPPHGHQSQLAK